MCRYIKGPFSGLSKTPVKADRTALGSPRRLAICQLALVPLDRRKQRSLMHSVSRDRSSLLTVPV
jgi:hypothetical protein